MTDRRVPSLDEAKAQFKRNGGTFVSSGCIRLTNEDITDLFTRVKVGTRVVVLPSKPVPVDSPAGVIAVTPSGVTSPSDMPRKRHKPEEIAGKLRQVDVLVSQGQSITDAIRQRGHIIAGAKKSVG